MSANPLEDDPEREHRIRERAYHLWNDDGRPTGHHDEYWERARELVGMEDSAGFGQLVNPETAGRDPSQSQPVEEAFLQENLGEFPDRLSDQGENQPTPMARRSGPKAEAAEPPPQDAPLEPAAKAKAPKAETAPKPPSSARAAKGKASGKGKK